MMITDAGFRLVKKNGEYFIQYRKYKKVVHRSGFWASLFPKAGDVEWVTGDWQTIETVDLDKEEK